MRQAAARRIGRYENRAFMKTVRKTDDREGTGEIRCRFFRYFTLSGKMPFLFAQNAQAV